MLFPIFFHPDFNCRPRNCTESALRLVGFTTGRETNPALKIYSIENRLPRFAATVKHFYRCEHRLIIGAVFSDQAMEGFEAHMPV